MHCINIHFNNYVAAAKAWNSLPDHVRDVTSLRAFRCQLKTVLFRQSYS